MEFHGFQNTFPTILIIILAIGLIVLAWFSYSKLKSISTTGRWILMSLRSAAFLIVLLLLLNPYFFSSRQVELTPKIALFFDNTESTTINKSEYNGLESYRALIQELDLVDIENVNIDIYSFGEHVKTSVLDSIQGTATQTNLSAPVQSVLEMNDNVQAAILISDGIITYGRNPVINSFNSSIPIYTIGIGDTSYVRDIALSNITTNTTGYTNTNHLIKADITQTGFEGETVNLQLITGNEIIQEQRLSFETNDQTKPITFEIPLNEPGLKQFEILSEPLQDEWTQNNNTGLVSIDVIDSRVRILHLAFAVHPDVKALRSLIESDQNNVLYSLTWLGNDRFIEEIPNLEQDEVDLLIVQGRPNTNVQIPVIRDLTNIPILFMELGGINTGNFSESTWNSYRLINSALNPAFQAKLKQNVNSSEHSILELPEVNLNDLPPLFSPRRSALNEPRASTLYNLVYNGVETSFPAVSISEMGNVRRSHVLPWGWFKMAQSSDPTIRAFYLNLFTNIISWTANNPDDRLLRVIPEKKIINSSSNPFLNGFVRNERGNPESDAVIEVEVESDNLSTRTFNMENIGEGSYRLELPKLSEGLYTFTANARKSGRLIETQQGEFLISNTSSEYSDTNRNDALLRSIANNSGGSYYIYNEMEGFWDELHRDGVISNNTVTIENYIFPVRYIYWFVLLVLILGSEWFLRKYYSLP
ncbi:vWA domain-containing protein [Gracilimonas sp. Q87]|uniref:vWA domain-containing protein n=1 Tax=Gracilimonas sp. Q87 TaxID=3384766 RepID=UPI003983EF9A